MIVRHFLTDNNESNVFLVACADRKEGLLVDAGGFPDALAEFLESEGIRLTTIFITHNHYDHTDGLQEALSNGAAMVLCGTGKVGGRLGRQVGHGDEVRIGRWAGKVLATPGHTPDSLSLVLPGLVFTGDALFAGSVGGTATSSLAQMQLDHLRRNVFSLPGHYEIHPGHGPSSTVAIERRHNPFFV